MTITVPWEVELGQRCAGTRKVVICGSMKDYALMARIGRLLRSAGLDAVAPAPDELPATPSDSPALRKRDASKRHMDHIRHRDTAAVLVVNVDRPGAKDYVGPNAFAEIGVAFSDDRPVFLLKGMPATYAEELVAWGVKCLYGNIQPLLDALAAPRPITEAEWAEIQYAQV